MTLAARSRLGRYEIRAPLGAGGMGEVYLAQDTALERTVAVKVLPTHVAANKQRVQRFIQEAKAASALNHPNILTIHEIGETDATCYIVMEFVDGTTLRQHLTGKQVKVSEVLDIMIQAAGALARAHQAGIVHRDIKPENIMVRTDGIVKVLDFGLAKLNLPVSTEIDSQAATRFKSDPGTVVGTAHYMSPEQVRALDIDPRSDIWSLGVVLYELVAGRLPFAGATTGDVIAAIIEREPPPLARFAPGVPHQLERIVTKALAKDRDERYQTVKDLLLDLKALRRELEFAAELDRTIAPELRASLAPVTKGVDTTAAPVHVSAAHTTAVGQVSTVSSAEYLVREIKTHKRGAIAVLGIFAVALVTAAYFLFFPRRAAAIDSIAVLPLVNASNDPNADYLSDGISESLINNLTQVPKLRVLARSTVFRYKGKEVDPQKVGRELGVRAVLTGRVQQRGDNLVIQADLIDVDNGSELWGEQYNRSISDLVAVQQDIAREITTKLRLKLSGEEEKQLVSRDSSNTEAYQLYLKGRYYWNKRTLDDLKKSIEYFQQAIEKDSRYALAYAALADAYNVIGTHPRFPPKEAFPKAKEDALKALELDDSLSEAHAALAFEKAHFEWDWPGAEKEFKRAIELNPNSANAHYFYAIAYLWPMGRLDDATVEFKRALEIEPVSLIINANAGWTYYFLRQYDRAIQQYQKALEIDPNFFIAHGHLVQAYEQKEMYEQALAEMEKMVNLDQTGAFTLAGFAAVKAAFKKSGAKGYWQARLEQVKEQVRKEYLAPSFIAILAAQSGDANQAFEWIEKALEARDGWLTLIKIEPQFDSLRSDPRYPDVLRRMGLPP